MESTIGEELAQEVEPLAKLVGLDLVGHRAVSVHPPVERGAEGVEGHAGVVPAGPVGAIAADAPGVGLAVAIGVVLGEGDRAARGLLGASSAWPCRASSPSRRGRSRGCHSAGAASAHRSTSP